MSYDVHIKVAPLFSLERFSNPKWAADRTLYDKLEFPPYTDKGKLLINHDEDREIGTVDRIFRMAWVDGDWWIAKATISGEPPPWVKRGCPASFSRKDLHRVEFTVGGATVDRVYHSWVEEVSLLGPGTRPAEPLAEVLRVAPSEVPPAFANVALAGTPRALSDSQLRAQLRADAWVANAPKGMLRRPAIGRVVAVR